MVYRRLFRSSWILSILVILVGIQATDINLQQKQVEQCQCLNGGTCPDNDKYFACSCPEGFIGTKCQTPAIQLSSSQKQTFISQEYSYFYFQPKEVNYYQISLKICLPQEVPSSQLTNLIFLQVQRSSGKLKLQPSIYQTSPITFQGKGDRCQTFYTHYIPIRKKVNDQYQKVIFGIAIKNNSDSTANRWVSFLQKSLSNSNQPFKFDDKMNLINDDPQQNQQKNTNTNNIQQIQNQKILISCSYQLYLVQNYWGTAIIIMSAMTLFISTAVFLYTIRNRYTYTFSNEDILRLYAINPQDFAHNQPTKNDLTHFNIIMPAMKYEVFKQKQKRAKIKHPRNLLKRRIQMHNEVAIIFQQKQRTQKHQTQKSLDLRSQNDDTHSTDSMNKQQLIKKYQSSICSSSKQSQQSHQNLCTICLINFQTDQDIRQTPCRHIFHAQCIDNWCQNTLNCPICRHNLQMPKIFTKRQLRALIDN